MSYCVSVLGIDRLYRRQRLSELAQGCAVFPVAGLRGALPGNSFTHGMDRWSGFQLYPLSLPFPNERERGRHDPVNPDGDRKGSALHLGTKYRTQYPLTADKNLLESRGSGTECGAVGTVQDPGRVRNPGRVLLHQHRVVLPRYLLIFLNLRASE